MHAAGLRQVCCPLRHADADPPLTMSTSTCEVDEPCQGIALYGIYAEEQEELTQSSCEADGHLPGLERS